MKNKNYLSLFGCLLFTVHLFAQYDGYQYLRPLENVTETWHEIELPNDFYSKVNRRLHDLRIIGITAENDTLEVPYILSLNEQKNSAESILFQRLNTTENKDGYFFTFEMKEKTPVNQILLDFQNDNFDWKITLEGSQNQQEWFTILTDYRLVSFKNHTTNYVFSTLNFPNAQYPFFRLKIPTTDVPSLKKARILQQKTELGKSTILTNLKVEKKEDKEEKQTVLDIWLPEVAPIISLKLPVETTYDYYRKITIQGLSDSTVTPKGTQYFYETLHRSVLSSLEKKEFQFKANRTQQLRVIIDNKDNQPLDFGTPEVKAAVYSLTARFHDASNFYLLYGNERALKPEYDLAQFISTIPDSLSLLSFGKEVQLELKKPAVVEPVFVNQWWLWAIMIAIILLLGGFTFKMMTSEKMK